MSIALLFLAAAAASAPGNDEQSLLALRDTGWCIVGETPWSVREVLAMDYRTPEYTRKLKELGSGVGGRCIHRASKLSSSGVLFAGSLAEAMLKANVKRKDLPKRIAYDPARQPIEARNPGEEMALCAALQAPDATAALLQTQPATREEAQAVQQIAPILGQCLKQGTQVEMNKPAIRAMLALAAWRIVAASKQEAQR